MARRKSDKPPAPVESVPAAETAVIIETIEKQRPGRPTDYNDSMPERARLCAAAAMTDFEIATALGICKFTFYAWVNKHPEFRAAVALGKQGPNKRVERSLYHRAVGYTFESEKVVVVDKKVVRVPILEHVPPDPKCMAMWLSRRMPDEWGAIDEETKKVEVIVKRFDWEKDEQAAPAGKLNGANGHGRLIEHEG